MLPQTLFIKKFRRDRQTVRFHRLLMLGKYQYPFSIQSCVSKAYYAVPPVAWLAESWECVVLTTVPPVAWLAESWECVVLTTVPLLAWLAESWECVVLTTVPLLAWLAESWDCIVLTTVPPIQSVQVMRLTTSRRQAYV
jgi:hypothetical protein